MANDSGTDLFSNLRSMDLSADGNSIVTELEAMQPGESTADPDSGEPAAPETPATPDTRTTATPETPAKEPAPETPESPDDPAAAPDASTTAQPETDQAAPAEPVIPDDVAEMIKAAAPLSYRVDGQDKTFDGILEIKGQGALIPQEHLERVRNTLSYAEKSIADNKALYRETQEYRALGGRQAYEALEREKAAVNAAGLKLLQTLQEAFPGEENAAIIQSVLREAQLDARDAEWALRGKHQQAITETQTAETRESQRGSALEGTYHQIAQAFPALTKDDWAAARSHFGQFREALFRPATAEECRANGWREGQEVVATERMASWFQDRAAQRSTFAAEAESRRKAELENKKRLAIPAAPPKPKPAARPSQRSATPPKAQKEGEKPSFADIRRSWNRGEFYAANPAGAED